MALAGPAGRPLLVLRALGLGDLLTAVPALRGLRRARPGSPLVLAAPAALAPLAALTGAVDALLPVAGLDAGPIPVAGGGAGPALVVGGDAGPAPVAGGDAGPALVVGGDAGPAPVAGGGAGRVRAAAVPVLDRVDRPALAVNLHGCGPQSTDLLAGTGPDRLWAYGLGPRWRADEHEVDRWCRLLAYHGVPADPADLRLDPPAVASPAPGATVLHPGAASGSRRWPVDRYAAVARALAADGHRVVVTAGPGERDLAAAVGAEPLSTGLAGLAALVAGARLVICGDTGVAHLATAYGTPSVLLFGPTPPAEWGPRGGPHRVLWRGRGRADPHGEHPDPALLALTVQDVLTEARRLVRAPAAP